MIRVEPLLNLMGWVFIALATGWAWVYYIAAAFCFAAIIVAAIDG